MRRLYLQTAVILFSTMGWCASSTKYPGTCANDATLPIGSIGTWAGPGNALADDGIISTVTVSAILSPSVYLKCSNYGFSIPLTATINGIVMESKNASSGNDVDDNKINIILADGTYGTEDKSDGTYEWPSVPLIYHTYGSSSDLWSQTWTPADINDVDFGIGISALRGGSGSPKGYVDTPRITVYYTDSAKRRRSIAIQ